MSPIIPATLAVLAALAAPLRAQEAQAPRDVRAWMDQYEAALNAKDLDRLAPFYHPDVTIYEGGGVNVGWTDYRDHHLGPELREMAGLRLTHANVQVQPLGSAAAYVISEYRLRARVKDEEVAEILRQGAQRSKADVAAALARAKQQRQLPPGLDEDAAADFVLTVMRGLRLSAKAGASVAETRNAVRMAMTALRHFSPEP